MPNSKDNSTDLARQAFHLLSEEGKSPTPENYAAAYYTVSKKNLKY